MIKFALGVLAGIILLGGYWYFKDEEKVVTPLSPPSWSELSAEIKTAFIAEGEPIEEQTTLKVIEEKDITGDGIPEALISTGSGGAASSFVALMRIENRKPVFAEIKDKDNKTFFLTGWPVGASAMHGQDMELLPSKNAVSLGSYSIDGSTENIKIEFCRNEAYVWNVGTNKFEWNSSLSESETKEYCEKVEGRIAE